MVYKEISFCRLSFHFFGFFCCAKSFQFDTVPTCLFLFYCLCFRCNFQKKPLPRFMSGSYFPMFSSRTFMISSLKGKFLTHFKLNLRGGVKQGSIFILIICEYLVFFQYYVLTRLVTLISVAPNDPCVSHLQNTLSSHPKASVLFPLKHQAQA